MLREGLRVLGTHPQPPESMLAIGRLRLGLCLAAKQEHEAAEPLLLDALALYRQTTGDEATDESVADAREALAELYTAWGRPDEAQAYR